MSCILKFIDNHRYFSPPTTAFNTILGRITRKFPGSALLLFEVKPEEWRKWNPDSSDSSDQPNLEMLRSQCATQGQIESDVYQKWCFEMKQVPRYSRKQWEYVYVLEALRQAGCLAPGQQGLGFAVGTEPVAAVLANYGAQVLATDLPAEHANADGWQRTGQHAATLQQLNSHEICEPARFAERVQFAPVNMLNIPRKFDGQFDFVWSCCALEHLGTLDAGLQFIENSLRCLRPGGVAVHTTEYCVNSNTKTISRSGTVLYRRQDLERFRERIRSQNYQMDLNFALGGDRWDRLVSLPPYQGSALCMYVRPFITTSIGLLIHQ